MARVLTDTEIREVCDLLIPIIRGEGSNNPMFIERLEERLRKYGRSARIIWKLITYEDYAGELI